MDFNELAVGLFNESESYFNILVFEDEECNIYGNTEKKLIVGRLKDINYKVITVEEITLINSEYYYKINYRNKIKGYFKPKDSIVLIPKVKQQVKLSASLDFNNEINTHLSLNENLFEKIKNKIVYSTSFAIYKDKVFELVVYKEEIVGFFNSSLINDLVKHSIEFRIAIGSAIYKDSFLTKLSSQISDDSNIYISDVVIPAENIVRFNNNGVLNWIPLSSTDIDYSNEKYKPVNASEALLNSIVYQYKDKLKKSHVYSLKIMNSK